MTVEVQLLTLLCLCNPQHHCPRKAWLRLHDGRGPTHLRSLPSLRTFLHDRLTILRRLTSTFSFSLSYTFSRNLFTLRFCQDCRNTHHYHTPLATV